MKAYEAKEKLHQEQMHKFVLNQLIEKGVVLSHSGKRIDECDYDELKQELVLQAFRDIDIETDSGKWF